MWEYIICRSYIFSIANSKLQLLRENAKSPLSGLQFCGRRPSDGPRTQNGGPESRTFAFSCSTRRFAKCYRAYIGIRTRWGDEPSRPEPSRPEPSRAKPTRSKPISICLRFADDFSFLHHGTAKPPSLKSSECLAGIREAITISSDSMFVPWNRYGMTQ